MRILTESVCIYIGIIVLLVSIFLICKKENKDNSRLSPSSETKAVFKKNNANGIICLLCGVLLIALFVFVCKKDSQATLRNLLIGVILGAICCSFGILFLLCNHKAYFYIENGHIKGKYHWFGKIDCDITDVVFAIGKNDSLLIQLRNGKCHTVMGIKNPWEVGAYICRNMPFDSKEQPEKLIDELKELKKVQKKNLINCCLFFAVMVVSAVVEVLLIGEKEMHEFNRNNWLVFVIMSLIEFAMLIVTFYFAQKTGKTNTPIEKLKYYIQRTIIETKPLTYGHMVKVLTDNNYSGRITVFGYVNDESVYYIVQEFAPDYTLFKSYESEIYENIDQLAEYFETLIDITEKFN